MGRFRFTRPLLPRKFLQDMKISFYTGGIVQTNGYLIETPDGNLLIDAPEGIADWITERGQGF